MKEVENILKINVKKVHKEALALKALMWALTGNTLEAYRCARVSVQENDQSPLCLIILGLLCESDFEYEEAIECFDKAININHVNRIELLIYLSLLQAKIWDLPGFLESRCRIMTLEPDKYLHQIAYIFSLHLNNNCLKPLEVLEVYNESLVDKHEKIFFYKISLLEDSGDFLKAMEELYKKQSTIVNHVAFREQEVSLLVKFNQFDEAKEIYKELLSLDSENRSYHSALVKCYVSLDEIEELTDFYISLGEQHNSSSIIKRIPLDFLQGEEFKNALETYVMTFLHEDERVHSLVSGLCPLYEHTDKAEIIDNAILGLETSIRETRNGEPIPILLWTLLAQLYDRHGQHKTALDKADEAIQQNPTVAELCLLKARILKHAGELETAASVAEKAKDMDPDNNFTRKKYVKRMLQADMDVEFIKDGGDLQNSLCNMECMWYEIASGDSYFRRGDLGRSLKNYLDVVKHYTKIIEDHLKFHYYESWEMSVRAYVETLKNREWLDPGSYFHKAVSGVVRCYIKLYDSSTKLDDETAKVHPFQKRMQELTASKVSHCEKLCDNKATKKQANEKLREKKLRKKQEKVDAKVLGNKIGEETSDNKASKSGVQQHPKPGDSDSAGAKLLQVENLLLEATKYLKLLQKNFPDSYETYFLLFELSMRKQEIVQAYKALNELDRLDADNPETLRCLVRFYVRLDSMVLEQSVRTALALPLSNLHQESLIKSIENFLKGHEDSLVHRVAAAEMWFFLQPYKKLAIIKFVEVTMEFAHDKKKLWRLKDCIEVHKLLKSVLGDATTASVWKDQCRQLFPFSSYFSAMTNDDTSLKAKKREEWLFDSGSTLHCTNNASNLLEKYDRPGTTLASSGNALSYSLYGPVLIQSEYFGRSYLLDEVCYISTGINIVSVKKFVTTETYLVQFFYDGFLLTDKRYIDMVSPKFILATGSIVKKVYMFVSKLPGEKEECTDWILDSGAFEHTTSDESLLVKDSIEDCETMTFAGADGITRSSSRKGSCELTYSSENGGARKFVLKDVYVVPGCPTLLSVSAFTRDNECSILFTPKQYYIMDAKNDGLLKPELTRGYGTVNRGLYYLC